MKIYIYTPFAEPEIQKFKDALSAKYEVIIGEEMSVGDREAQFRTCEICYGNPPLTWLANVLIYLPETL